MDEPLSDGNPIDFGTLPAAVNALLQQGVIAYRRDRSHADRLFRQALAADPHQLPTYFCLYKIHTYQGNLDEALAAAEAGLQEAARQAGWSTDWRNWPPQTAMPAGPERFALYTLKALAFIHLRRNEPAHAQSLLDQLAHLDPSGTVGWPVVAELAQGLGQAPPSATRT